jgi:hypothetical protein
MVMQLIHKQCVNTFEKEPKNAPNAPVVKIYPKIYFYLNECSIFVLRRPIFVRYHWTAKHASDEKHAINRCGTGEWPVPWRIVGKDCAV